MAKEHSRETGTEGLNELVLTSSHVEEFLQELAVLAADQLFLPGHDVSCSVTLVRHKRPATVASSDARARAMDEVQYHFNEGPCLTALGEEATVYVPDLESEQRWRDYLHAVDKRELRSVLAVPFQAEGGAKAALNLYSDQPDGFPPEFIEKAEQFAWQASRSLRLALRIAQLTDSRNDLSAAMESRTIIDLAAGAIMGQNHCSQETAMTILKRASSSRNLKLREVAATVVASVSQDASVSTHFDA
ncbi:GAF and ANTAR domain-containing protein [Pseudarthrobacter sp. NamE5]|uniref:GAF and ANTAR domain-containing protein n=1 Tax=Pseudarthrobacter sp. NamE5 TaxID=2576839 RepID=UPI00110A752E|nr:GAF and ANTAR domain-containing protein [Pseudarthrobacter sp. NamE5]TLM84693.1 GAF and ANTAR domain-containing protein [Pseudarthrobacter sp. NamE5]